MEKSAGILVYKFEGEDLKILLVHAGGPFWEKKDEAAWSIPKGLVENEENVEDAARREFHEEVGTLIDNKLYELGSVKSGSKQICIFVCEKNIDISNFKSNYFEMEWPPKSGKMQSFPENDKAEWLSIDDARKKIFKGQLPFIDKLLKYLKDMGRGD